MQIWDLTEKSNHHRRAALSQKLDASNGKFNAGEVIEFWTGYNNDIRARAEIAGTKGDDIYLIWDCYWFPIQDDSARAINHNKQE